MEKVSQEVALKEVTKWLDFKKVDTKKRETNEDSINTMVDAIMAGNLVLDKEFNFIQTLKFPVGADESIKTFKYKPRVSVSAIETKMQNVKGTNSMGLIGAYVSAITDLNSGVVKLLDTEDNRVAQAIATFFL